MSKYCWRFGEHKDDPCPCGWSSKTDKDSKIKRLHEIIDKLLELGDDLRCYTHDWDWKYGEAWDKDLDEIREATIAEGK